MNSNLLFDQHVLERENQSPINPEPSSKSVEGSGMEAGLRLVMVTLLPLGSAPTMPERDKLLRTCRCIETHLKREISHPAVSNDVLVEPKNQKPGIPRGQSIEVKTLTRKSGRTAGLCSGKTQSVRIV